MFAMSAVKTLNFFWNNIGAIDTSGLLLWLIITLTLYVVHCYRVTYSFWSSRGIKGPTPLPFFGNTLTYILNSVPEVDIINRDLFGKTYGVYHGNKPVLITSDPEIIEKVFNSQHTSFQFHHDSALDDPMVTNALPLKHGHDAKRIRSVITSCMTHAKLRNYLEMMNTDDLMSHIKLFEGIFININDLGSLFLMKSFIHIFYGLDLDLFKNPDHEIIKHSYDMFDYFNFLPSFLSARLPFLLKFCADKSGPANNYFSNLFKFAVKGRIKAGGKVGEGRAIRKDFLQQFMDSNLTAEEKEANANLLLGAAYDTTTSTFSFMLYELAKNKTCMKQVQEELDELFKRDSKMTGNEKQSNGNDVLKKLKSLPYFDKCFYETIRMHPGIIRTSRGSSEQTVIPTLNVTIPYGIEINIATHPLHYDPDLFDDPFNYDPDRWTEDRVRESARRCTSFIFGTGPRKCPGGRLALVIIKVALINILRLYDIDVSEKTDIRSPPGNVTTQPRNIWIKFVSRAENASKF